jgi:hypothetical protein
MKNAYKKYKFTKYQFMKRNLCILMFAKCVFRLKDSRIVFVLSIMFPTTAHFEMFVWQLGLKSLNLPIIPKRMNKN